MDEIYLTQKQANWIVATLENGKLSEVSEAFDLLLDASDFTDMQRLDLYKNVGKYLDDANIPVGIVQKALWTLYRSPDINEYLPYVIKLSGSKNAQIRKTVASVLGNFAEWDEATEKAIANDKVIKLALNLAEDSVASVRDWAVFQFCNGIDNDSEAIRKVLKKGAKDKNLRVRQESICALAIRRDDRVYDEILKQIRKVNVAPVWVQAAAGSGDERFVEPLMKLKEKASKNKDYNLTADLVSEVLSDLNTLLIQISKNKVN